MLQCDVVAVMLDQSPAGGALDVVISMGIRGRWRELAVLPRRRRLHLALRRLLLHHEHHEGVIAGMQQGIVSRLGCHELENNCSLR